MFKVSQYFCIFLVVFVLFASLVTAQSRFDAGNFSSSRGLFSVEIPIKFTGSTTLPISLKDSAELGEGFSYRWSAKQIQFRADFIDMNKNIDTLQLKDANLLEVLFSNFAQNANSDLTKKNLSKKDIFVNQNVGKEIKFSKDNTQYVFRFFVKNKVFFRLITSFDDEQNRTLSETYMGSFRAISYKEAITNIIERATPKDFPQNTDFPKNVSDVFDERLKGSIKIVVEESEAIVNAKRQLLYSTFYDLQGNRTKVISYDEDEHPQYVQVFGFIENMRVSKTGFIQTETRSFGRMAFPNKNKPDERYLDRFEYIYDEKKRLKEKITYRNDGEVSYRIIFDYKENQVEETGYKVDKLEYKTISIYDKNGLLIEETIINSPNRTSSERKFSYKYEIFDEKNNWTKRIVLFQKTENGKSVFVPVRNTFRTITYYE
jgi:hypothetical protein